MNWLSTEFVNKVGKWADENFPNNDLYNCALGVFEEFGELCHALLKKRQGIRKATDSDIRDAIADVMIYYANAIYEYNKSLDAPKDSLENKVLDYAFFYGNPLGHASEVVHKVRLLCERLGIDPVKLAEEVFENEVSKRDWKKYKVDGVSQ